ncbi:MAG: hypothetical protein U9O24_01665 [Campylobacterota bacterium]|nr:hypothetical protein [Campylobacterota bacterium]
MEEFLVVPIVEIDPSWSLRGFPHNYYASEYCRVVLGIPLDYLEDAHLSDDRLEINLIDSEEITEEEWYIQLRRISKYTSS